MMAKRATQAKPDPTMLLQLAAIGVVGLIVARRYGVVNGLHTVNRALARQRSASRFRYAVFGVEGSAIIAYLSCRYLPRTTTTRRPGTHTPSHSPAGPSFVLPRQHWFGGG